MVCSSLPLVPYQFHRACNPVCRLLFGIFHSIPTAYAPVWEEIPRRGWVIAKADLCLHAYLQQNARTEMIKACLIDTPSGSAETGGILRLLLLITPHELSNIDLVDANAVNSTLT